MLYEVITGLVAAGHGRLNGQPLVGFHQLQQTLGVRVERCHVERHGAGLGDHRRDLHRAIIGQAGNGAVVAGVDSYNFV